jgi:CubicO group peptidase (beta-lactamase class C family)
VTLHRFKPHPRLDGAGRACATRARPGGTAAQLALILLFGAVTGAAAGPDGPSKRPVDAIDAARLERWVGAWFGTHLRGPAAGAPGAVVAVVKDDRVLLVRGFGYADVAAGTRVGPDTVFRVGSVSKPVTATAVMQLVEAGRIDVRRPANDYLADFQLPAAIGRPVTVLDLLTHTGGFDVRLAGTAAPSDRAVQRLGDYLGRNMPPQVRPAGEMLSYSNHGYALLGHLVESITGESFEDYAAAHVFAPLGMRRSGFRLTAALAAHAATGYEPSSAGFAPSEPVHPNIYPAAGLNTTGADMARFMLAQLNGGRLEDARILSTESIAAMHRRQFTVAPEMPGVAFGFFEFSLRGERGLMHGGGIRGFMSGIYLWPRDRLGLFVSNNGYSADLVTSFADAFLDHYYPGREATTERLFERPSMESFTGSYRPASHPRGTLEKAGALRGGDLELDVDYRRRLRIGRDPFTQLGARRFLGADRDELLGFAVGRPGAGPYLITTDLLSGNVAWEKLRWYETARFHRELLTLFLLGFVSVLVVPHRWLSRAWPGPTAASCPGSRLARGVLVAVAGLNLLFVVLLVVAFRLAGGAGLLYGVPAAVRFVLVLPICSSVLAAGLPYFAWRSWHSGYWSVPARWHYSACAVAAVGFAALLKYWNLLGS